MRTPKRWEVVWPEAVLAYACLELPKHPFWIGAGAWALIAVWDWFRFRPRRAAQKTLRVEIRGDVADLRRAIDRQIGRKRTPPR